MVPAHTRGGPSWGQHWIKVLLNFWRKTWRWAKVFTNFRVVNIRNDCIYSPSFRGQVPKFRAYKESCTDASCEPVELKTRDCPTAKEWPERSPLWWKTFFGLETAVKRIKQDIITQVPQLDGYPGGNLLQLDFTDETFKSSSLAIIDKISLGLRQSSLIDTSQRKRKWKTYRAQGCSR